MWRIRSRRSERVVTNRVVFRLSGWGLGSHPPKLSHVRSGLEILDFNGFWSKLPKPFIQNLISVGIAKYFKNIYEFSNQSSHFFGILFHRQIFKSKFSFFAYIFITKLTFRWELTISNHFIFLLLYSFYIILHTTTLTSKSTATITSVSTTKSNSTSNFTSNSTSTPSLSSAASSTVASTSASAAA